MHLKDLFLPSHICSDFSGAWGKKKAKMKRILYMCALNEGSAVAGAALQALDPWIQIQSKMQEKGIGGAWQNIAIQSILIPFQGSQSISARRALESVREVNKGAS